MNDITLQLASFSQFFDSAAAIFQSADADVNKVGFSRLADLLVRIMVNKVASHFLRKRREGQKFKGRIEFWTLRSTEIGMGS